MKLLEFGDLVRLRNGSIYIYYKCGRHTYFYREDGYYIYNPKSIYKDGGLKSSYGKSFDILDILKPSLKYRVLENSRGQYPDFSLEFIREAYKHSVSKLNFIYLYV